MRHLEEVSHGKNLGLCSGSEMDKRSPLCMMIGDKGHETNLQREFKMAKMLETLPEASPEHHPKFEIKKIDVHLSCNRKKSIKGYTDTTKIDTKPSSSQAMMQNLQPKQIITSTKGNLEKCADVKCKRNHVESPVHKLVTTAIKQLTELPSVSIISDKSYKGDRSCCYMEKTSPPKIEKVRLKQSDKSPAHIKDAKMKLQPHIAKTHLNAGQSNDLVAMNYIANEYECPLEQLSTLNKEISKDQSMEIKPSDIPYSTMHHLPKSK